MHPKRQRMLLLVGMLHRAGAVTPPVLTGRLKASGSASAFFCGKA